MMGRRSGQIGMQIVDVEMMIPQNHLLRKIDMNIPPNECAKTGQIEH